MKLKAFYDQFKARDACPEWFQIISIVRISALIYMVPFMIPRINHFFLKHLPPFTKGSLQQI